jgi:hypothetical protein
MAMLFAVPRLFLISKREADRPRLGRTPPELLPTGGARTFSTRKQVRPRSSPENGTTRLAYLTGNDQG